MDLDAQGGDLGGEGGVFGFLAFEESDDDAGLGLDALRGEQAEIGELVLVTSEVLDLYPTLVDQGAQAVVWCGRG